MWGRLAVATLAATLVWTGAAAANTFEVTRLNDPVPDGCKRNDCSLREAVLRSNARTGRDVIVLPNRKRPYRLTRTGSGEDEAMNGDLDLVNDSIAIVHRGKGRATVDGEAAGERVFESFVPTTLSKLVVRGGNAQTGEDSGGAIEAKSSLTVSNSVLRANRVSKFGGAIYHNNGTLRVLSSKLVANRALDESGAIEASGARTVIKRSALVNNRADAGNAGAIYVASELLVERSALTGNRALLDGGAIYINNGDSAIHSSTFSRNRSNRDGGAIASHSPNTEIVNSTFSGNRAADWGGAIWNRGSMVVNAITVARNVSNSDDAGGGSGGGIYNFTGFTVEIVNSLLALNDQLGGDADDCAGVFTSAGGNLRSNGVDCGGFDGTRDTIKANAKIGKLKRNGGPTPTIALLKGSPAIRRAIKAFAPQRDQRGRRRDARPDSGAYERGA